MVYADAYESHTPNTSMALIIVGACALGAIRPSYNTPYPKTNKAQPPAAVAHLLPLSRAPLTDVDMRQEAGLLVEGFPQSEALLSVLLTATYLSVNNVERQQQERGSHKARSASVEWKKDSDPAVAADAKSKPMKLVLDLLLWSFQSSFMRLLMPLIFPSSRCFYDVDESEGVRGLVALTFDDCFVRQSNESKSLVDPLREILVRRRCCA